MLHPTKVVQILVKSWFGRLRKEATFDTKSDQKLDRKLNRHVHDFLEVLVSISGELLKAFSGPKAIEKQMEEWMDVWIDP